MSDAKNVIDVVSIIPQIKKLDVSMKDKRLENCIYVG